MRNPERDKLAGSVQAELRKHKGWARHLEPDIGRPALIALRVSDRDSPIRLAKSYGFLPLGGHARRVHAHRLIIFLGCKGLFDFRILAVGRT
jgi:hypothetical protein